MEQDTQVRQQFWKKRAALDRESWWPRGEATGVSIDLEKIEEAKGEEGIVGMQLIGGNSEGFS